MTSKIVSEGVGTYLLFPLSRSLLMPAIESLERETFSSSFLGIARPFELAGREAPSNLLVPFVDPDLKRGKKFSHIDVSSFVVQNNICEKW